MANKKINQLVAKTTILSTDLFPLGNPTTGQLFKKTIGELQAAIGGAVISVNGLVGTVVLDTDDIQELATPTNKYFTDARARAAISLTVTGNSGASTYSNSTGVLNVPTYTLAGLGGITATFLSGASGIAYNSSTGVITYTGTVYTDASIRALLSAGAGISYNSSTGAISYSGTVYTDASIRALISLTTTGNSGVSSYNNTTGVLNVPNYTLAGLGGISLTSLSGTAPITYNSTTGAIGISQANTTTNGFLSSTDWNTFNGKQSALTLGNVSEVVSNVLMFPDGGTNKTIGNLTIQVVQAGSTTNGFLSTTDWNTFNNKQGTITLTTTGTSGAATFSAGTLNIPQYQAVLTNPVTGTGTSGHVAYFNGSGSIAGSANHFWDNTNGRLGIGTNTPTAALQIVGTGAGSIGTINIKGVSSHIGIQSSAGVFKGWFGYFNNATHGNDNDLNIITGYASASNIRFGVNGGTSDAMLIASNGNVGIGTNSPNSFGGGYRTLAIAGTGTEGGMIQSMVGSTSALYIGTNSSQCFFAEPRNVFMTFSTNDTERIRITAAGNVGIGTTNPVFKLSVAGNITMDGDINAAQFMVCGTDVDKRIVFGYDTNGNGFGYIKSAFRNVAWTPIVLNPNGGNILLGTTTDNGEKLYVSGSIRATGSITANSDVRLKKNIERIENALQKVSEISGYTYNTIYDEDRHAGVIAQEIDKVLPEIVNKGNDGLMGVEYGNISALLIEAIKEQKVLIESLQAKVEALEK